MQPIVIGKYKESQLDQLPHFLSENSGFEPAFIIAFISPHLDFHDVNQRLVELASDTPFLAVQTAGELCHYTDKNESLYGLDCAEAEVVVQAFGKDLFSHISLHDVSLYCEDIREGHIALETHERIEKIKQACTAIKPSFPVASHDSFALTFVDGLSRSESYLLEALYSTKQFPCMFIGGSSGKSENCREAYLSINGKVLTNAAVIAFCKMAPGKRFSPFKTQSSEVIHDKSCIVVEATSEMREIKTVLDIENMEVLSMQEQLRRFLDCDLKDLQDSVKGYGLGMLVGDELFRRDIDKIKEDGQSLTLYCDVNVGDQIYLTRDSDLVQKTKADTETFLQGKPRAIGGILNDCLLRRLNNEHQLSDMDDLYDFPVAGFSTFGEIFGININNTLSALFFFDVGDKEAFHDPFMDHFAIHFASFMNSYAEYRLNRVAVFNDLRNIIVDRVTRHMERFNEISKYVQDSFNQNNLDLLNQAVEENNILLQKTYGLLNIVDIVDLEERQHYDKETSASKLLYNTLIKNIELNFKIFDYIQNLHNSREKAEKANAAKSEFLANMSHELRTPMNSILGLAKILFEDKTLDAEHRDMLNVIFMSSSSMLEIVNDILDLSKFEAGGIILEKRAFDFKTMSGNVIKTLAPLASQKGLVLKLSYKSEDWPYLIGDETRLNRIFTNVIGNAIKYTQDGLVEVTLGHQAIADGGVELTCIIKDTGIGIPDNKLDYIFEKFTQADESINRKFGGTGLGLAITKGLIEFMGGSITVTSKVNEGSCFTIHIPFMTADKLATEDTRQVPISPKPSYQKDRMPIEQARILVAEDHQLNQIFVEKLLGRMNVAHFDIANNGIEALRQLKEADYDLILMDCHMPEKNGYKTTEEIRAARNNIPIVAMTADVMPGTREKCIETGMNDYVSKPINEDALQQVMSCWFVFPDEISDEQDQLSRVKDASDSGDPVADEDCDPPADLQVLRNCTDGDLEKEKTFIDIFLSQSMESLEILRNHCLEGVCAPWVEAAHKMKGGAGMMGAEKLQLLCAQAQQMADVSASQRASMLKDIEEAYEEVKLFLTSLH